MEQITVRLAENTLEEVDQIAENRNTSRTEVIREALNSEEDADDIRAEFEAEVAALREEIDDLERENERLRREKLKSAR